MTILEENSTPLKSSSLSSKKEKDTTIAEDTNQNHIEIASSRSGSSKTDLRSVSTLLTSASFDRNNSEVIRARALSLSANSAMISAVGDRYITPEYLAPLPSSSV